MALTQLTDGVMKHSPHSKDTTGIPDDIVRKFEEVESRE